MLYNFDIEKLNKKIENSGFKKGFVAKKLGLSPYGLSRKMKGKNEFKVKEANLLASLLNLSDKEKLEIFFKDSSH